jgi:hypothetical protein
MIRVHSTPWQGNGPSARIDAVAQNVGTTNAENGTCHNRLASVFGIAFDEGIDFRNFLEPEGIRRRLGSDRRDRFYLRVYCAFPICFSST